ncbi:glycosyltransferase family 2 protein [Patulibacter defluvii]|uniref:glycosyltransferase family 2 protein n=1 Tax=Patulibacter defluvii TaxID=3095358 RepID=UPI002A758E22|nr:glycosyltransferase [Patulibacter sp. DM4]
MPAPLVSVVVPTRDRPERLARLLDGLRAQTLGAERIEVIVCDDASAEPAVAALLDAAVARGDLALRVLRQERPRGPAVARNRGWRTATAPLVAFVDDDCVPQPRWLEALLDGWQTGTADGDPALALVQGRVLPDPAEYPQRFGPFSTTLWVHEAGPRFETANIAYPRALLERLDGFDESLVIAGEDTDLGWRAIEAGARVIWAGAALVHHGVIQQGPWGRLAKGWRWRYVPAVFRRHPGLRRELIAGVFWSRWHWWLFRAAAALLLRPRAPARAARPGGLRGPRRGPGWALLRWWLAMPYVLRLVDYRSGPLLAPYRLACDLVEVAAIGTGAVRHRIVML